MFAEQFEVVRLLPPEKGVFQYRVRSIRDGHERAVFESELVGKPPERRGRSGHRRDARLAETPGLFGELFVILGNV